MLMKKLFTLALLVLGLSLVTTQAQVKKTWDFTQGVSEETITNLDTDTKWAVTYNDDGSFKQASEATKLSGEFKANGNLIEELKGLSLGTAGLSKSNNCIIMPTRFRLNRNKMEIIFPKLVNGQTITIVGRSANSSAEDRGIKASYEYMKRIEGPEDNLIRASLGEVTNKWEVVTDSPDSVDIKFTMITGGVDFTLFMIDNGDEAKTAKVAYLYDGNEDDQVLGYLQANELYDVTPINVTTSTIVAEGLRDYEVTIVGASVPADNAAVSVLKEALPWTPVLNLNATIYNAWGYGEAAEISSRAIAVKATSNALFKDVELNEEDKMPIAKTGKMQGVKLGEYFDGDAILAVNSFDAEGDDVIVAIHTHNISHNGYVFLPLNATEITDEALELLPNAISTLQNSKRDITPATAPTLSREYKHLQTFVTIATPNLPKAKVYYTTDGSEPSTESILYTGTFSLAEPCTVKAATIAEGYTLSPTATLDILIKEQPKTPVISYEMGDGQTTINLTCETPDAKIWYNYANATDTTKSTQYIDSIPVIIKMPQNVTAFATTLEDDPAEAVVSEVATQRVLVKNPRVVIDVAGHFRAAKWDGVDNGSGVFPNGKTATSMYDTTKDPIGTTTDPETGDETPLYPEVEWMIKDEAGEAPEWMVMTKGQSVLWQNLTAQTSQIGTDDGGYFPSAAEDIDQLFPITNYDVQFYNIFSGEHANAAIQSKNKYQAPLDVVVLCNMQGGPLLVQTSPDGENWTTVGDEIAKTGKKRMWKKYTRMYEGNDEVYVRVAQLTGDASAKVFDVYVANQGEKSQELLEELNQELSGISDVQQAGSKKAVSGIYNLRGMRLTQLQRGLNIVVDANGQTRKLMVK